MNSPIMPSLFDTLCFAKTEFNMSEAQHLKLLLRYQEEKNDLSSRKFKKILEQEYQLGKLGILNIKLKDLETQYAVQIKEQTAEKHHNRYCWCTINPKSDITFAMFKKKVEKIVKYSCFEGYIYVFEQRGTLGEKNIGKGFHAHLLFRRNLSYKPKDLEQRIRRGCKGIVGNIMDNKFVNLAKIGKDFALDKYKYMTDLKKSEKQEKQKGDIIFRKTHKLQSMYNNNFLLDIINA